MSNDKESGAMNTPAKVYTLFFSKGYGSAEIPPDTILTNEALLEKLKTQCPEIGDAIRDLTIPELSFDAAANEIESVKNEIDGVLIIGAPRDYQFLYRVTAPHGI